MIHAFGFREVGFHHISASIVPHNTASPSMRSTESGTAALITAPPAHRRC